MTDSTRREGEPAGGVYDWFVRARSLHDAGNPEAAAELLSHARRREPESASVLEALARALFDARRYPEAERHFTELVEASPDSDYARFGLGLCRMRLGDHGGAAEQLSMAAAMRPGRRDYQQALREARATVRARAEAAERAAHEEPGAQRSSEPGR